MYTLSTTPPTRSRVSPPGFHNEATGLEMVYVMIWFEVIWVGRLSLQHVCNLCDSNAGVFSFAAWVGSVSTGLTFLMSMVASILSDRFGIRKTGFIGGMLGFIGLVSSAFVQRLELLYLTFGILLGIGSSLIYSPSLIVLGHYFKKHMGLVNGLVSFGSGLFTIIFSLTMPKLLKNIGLQNTFLFLCGIYFVAWMLTFTWRPIMPTANHLPLALSIESIQERRRDCTRWMSKFLNVKIWRNKGYVVWCLSSAVCLFGYFVPFVHLVSICMY